MPTTPIAFPLLDDSLAPIMPGHSMPSQRLVNEAALIIYGCWRGIGLSHDEALEWAAFFARRVARISGHADGYATRPQRGPAEAAIAAIVADAMASA